jgi:hypothetical protein
MEIEMNKYGQLLPTGRKDFCCPKCLRSYDEVRPNSNLTCVCGNTLATEDEHLDLEQSFLVDTNND